MSAKIKFNKFAITDGKLKARVFYSVDNRTDGRKCVTIYAKDYDSDLALLFKDSYKNDTDTMTDYFDKGKVVLFEGHPHYADARLRATEGKEESKSVIANPVPVNHPLTEAFKTLESVPVASFSGVSEKKPAMGKEVTALEYVKGEIRRRMELAEKRAEIYFNNLLASNPNLKGALDDKGFREVEDRATRLSIALRELEGLDLWADLSGPNVKV